MVRVLAVRPNTAVVVVRNEEEKRTMVDALLWAESDLAEQITKYALETRL
jgi:hypothetical protein